MYIYIYIYIYIYSAGEQLRGAAGVDAAAWPI